VERRVAHAERLEDPGPEELVECLPDTTSTTRPSTSVDTP
jgi:hypothetical protein